MSDKLVDIEVMTKDCCGCKYSESKQNGPGYESWQLTHECRINYMGSSSSMESECAVKIFNCSIENKIAIHQLYR